ncbi:MAG: DUF916 domain-containing protein, partial [Candidatus Nomurabacteria bacterium]|jgi:hypothetical protein|nr:DUF916 domain-containing protein [Candidatus Nomurabacteria bacterium]
MSVGLVGFGGVVRAVDCESEQATTVTIQTASERLKLEPEQEYERSFVVVNDGCADYTFTVAATPYAPDDNYANSFEIENKWTQISRYIELPTAKFELAAGQSVEVPFVIKVPSQDLIAAGGQYAAIAVEVAGNGKAGVSISQRVMYQIYAQVAGDVAESGEVTAWQIPRWVEGGELATTYAVRNNGNVDFGAKGRLVVKGLFGGKVYETPEKQAVYTFAFPETSPPEATVTWADTRIGFFWVTQEVEIFGEVTSHTRLVLVAPVWLVVVLGIGLVAAGVLVGYNLVRELRRRRKSRK